MLPIRFACCVVLACAVACSAASWREPVAFVPGVFASTPGMVNSGTPPLVPPSADCAIRSLAWEYGKSLKPDKGGFADLYDALQLHACGVPTPPTRGSWSPPASPLPGTERRHVLHVDPRSKVPGVPTGGVESPFPTLHSAVARSRERREPADILLRGGTHYLGELGPVELGPVDSGLRIANFPGEEAIVSGGVGLKPAWKPSAACKGCFEAVLPHAITSVPGLRRNGIREIRCRWPNFDEELDSVDEDGVYHTHNGRDGWVRQATRWSMNGTDMNGIKGPWPPLEPPKTYIMGADDWPGVEWPMREYINASNGSAVATSDKWTGEGDWGQFWISTGGTCADRTPALGYWCATQAPRHISAANHPGGIYAEPVRGISYRDPAGAIVHSWMPYHVSSVH